MKRSPSFHLALGSLVVIAAYILGVMSHSPKKTVAPTVVLTPAPAPTITTQLVIDSDLIIKFKDNAEPAGIKSLLNRLNAAVFNYDSLPGFSFQRVRSAMSLQELIDLYKSDPNVEYVEPNYLFHADETRPNDPFFKQMWGHSNTGQEIAGGPGGEPGADIDALTAWDVTTGSNNIVVAVIDSGIDYTHPDLKANMWINRDEVPGDGVDNDDNGVVDDIHGYNAVNNNGDPLDDADHGTHCAGIIGAVGDNGIGIAGINWKVKLMALKFLSVSGGGRLNDVIECINYVIKMKKRGVNVRIMSNSWGGGSYSRALEDAIKAANNAGILFVAAAGNDSQDTDHFPHYPSSYQIENVISVAALDRNDNLARFSNFGAESVHLGAPGVEIYSTVRNSSYRFMSGTSMATPYAAGVAALVLAREPRLSVKDLKKRLIESTTEVAALKGKTISGGRLNAARALKAGKMLP